MTLPTPPPDPAWPPDPGRRHDAGDPDEAFPVPFTVLDGFLMVGWTILAQLLVGGPAIALGLDPDDPLQLVVLTVVVQLATLAGVLGWLAVRGGLSWRVLGPVRPRLRHWFIGVGIGLAALVIVLTTAELTNQLFGPFEAPDQALLQLEPGSATATVLLVVAAVGLAPVVEELVFRGLLFQSIRRAIGLSGAMVLSALVFAFIHLELVVPDPNAPALVGLIALGLWLAGAFHRTGSLIVPVVAHASYNGLVLVFVLLADSAESVVG